MFLLERDVIMTHTTNHELPNRHTTTTPATTMITTTTTTTTNELMSFVSSTNPILIIPSKPDIHIQHRMETRTIPHLNTNPSEGQQKQSQNQNQLIWNTNMTCQVQIYIHPDDQSWILISCDQFGQPKTMGGDEFYIRYQEHYDCPAKNHNKDNENCMNPSSIHAMAVAVVTHDCTNHGRYQLDFCMTPTSDEFPILPAFKESSGHDDGDDDDDDDDNNKYGILTIDFEYSCHIGQMAPPTKQTWENGGYTHTQYSIIIPSSMRPPIRRFVPPQEPNLSRYDWVLAFGDSTFDQLVRQRPSTKGKYYFQSNILVGEKIRIGLSSKTLDEFFQLLSDEFGMLMEGKTETATANTTITNKNQSIALIIGSCLWDILDSQDTLQGQEYGDHAQACRDLIRRIRTTYPNITIVWKSPMAVHCHWVNLDRLVDATTGMPSLFGIDRLRYMSASRSRYLYELQRSIMKEMDVPMLDLYEATYLSADLLYPSDGRHYRPEFNRLMLSWFYNNESNKGKYFENRKP